MRKDYYYPPGALSFDERLARLANLDLSEMLVCVDFDGTCVTHEFPAIGKEVPLAVSVLRALSAARCRLILWTIRSDQPEIANDPHGTEGREYLVYACRWMLEKGVTLYGVNKNHQQRQWSSSPKAYAHVYIDDAACGCPLVHKPDFARRPYADWDKILTDLLIRFESECK